MSSGEKSDPRDLHLAYTHAAAYSSSAELTSLAAIETAKHASASAESAAESAAHAARLGNLAPSNAHYIAAQTLANAGSHSANMCSLNAIIAAKAAADAFFHAENPPATRVWR